MDTWARVAMMIASYPRGNKASHEIAADIMRIVDEERAELVKALLECKRLVDCGEWGDVPSVVDAALGERR